MKQNNAKLVNSYAAAIFKVAGGEAKMLEGVLCQLNAAENILQNYNAKTFNTDSFCSVIKSLNLHDVVRNVLITLSQKSRLDLVSLLVDVLKQKFEFAFGIAVATIYAPSVEVANKIKLEKFANQTIVFKLSQKIMVTLQNKVVDFSAGARLSALKSQVLKNLSNI